jgi:DNA-binding HxlR family transcriptional regulator
MSVPKPGSRVRGSSTGRPIMAALDLFGRRWTLRVLWELRTGPHGFRPLQRACDDMSSSVLGERLSELEDVALVTRTADGQYELTALGRELGDAIGPLESWARRWEATLLRK